MKVALCSCQPLNCLLRIVYSVLWMEKCKGKVQPNWFQHHGLSVCVVYGVLLGKKYLNSEKLYRVYYVPVYKYAKYEGHV